MHSSHHSTVLFYAQVHLGGPTIDASQARTSEPPHAPRCFPVSG